MDLKKDAFDKDNKGFVTSIITPRSISGDETPIEWVQFDVDKTKAVNKNTHLYLLGYTNEDIPPPVISQGYRIGARVAERIYLDDDSYFGEVLMTNGPLTSGNQTIQGFETSVKQYKDVVLFNDPNKGTIYILGANHTLKNGESIRIFSETGDLPEGLEENTLYYAITNEKKSNLAVNEIQIASSRTNADAQIPIFITSFGGVELRVESRVSDKEAGELGSPIQWDPNQNQWMIHIKVLVIQVLFGHTLTLSLHQRVKFHTSREKKMKEVWMKNCTNFVMLYPKNLLMVEILSLGLFFKILVLQMSEQFLTLR